MILPDVFVTSVVSACIEKSRPRVIQNRPTSSKRYVEPEKAVTCPNPKPTPASHRYALLWHSAVAEPVGGGKWAIAPNPEKNRRVGN